MARPLTATGLERLRKLAGERDRTGYYRALGDETDDPYATLALGVVKGSQVSGRVAANFAKEVGRRYCHPIDDTKWTAIGEGLMRADLVARTDDGGRNPDGTLSWRTIRDYHVAVFGAPEFGLPPFAWTAWIPLELQPSDDARAALWAEMLARTILPVALDTVKGVLASLPDWMQKATGLYRLLIPTLYWNTPIASGDPGSPGFQACMREMTRLQLDQSAKLTPQQHYALFYLDVLSTNWKDLGSGMAIGPTSAWRYLRGTDTAVSVPAKPELRVTP